MSPAFSLSLLPLILVAASAGPSSAPAIDSRLVEARQALQRQAPTEALESLQVALNLDLTSVPATAADLARDQPLAATLLARASQALGREDLAVPLFEALHRRAEAEGDRAVAARLAVRLGDVLTANGQPLQAVSWYQRAAAEDVLLRASLGLARALRRAGQAKTALESLRKLEPLQLASDQPLRPALLAEAARCAAAAGEQELRLKWLAALWSEHPADDHRYPGADADLDPMAGVSRSRLMALAGDAGRVQRAEGLLDANLLDAALAAASEAPPTDPALRCRLDYVKGKTLRNLRRYSSATAALTPLIDRCPEQAPKALYLLGRVASFRGRRAEAQASFDRFAATYPAHDYTDDVLFFAGDQLTQQGQHIEAERYYQRVADEHPEGDYADEARWRLAWGAFLAGKTNLATQRLNAIARATTSSADSRPYLQAVYWRARLSLDSDREGALDDLVGLLRADPTSYYGMQARALLHRQVPKRARELDAWLITQAREVQASAAKATPPKLPELPAAQLGQALVAAGLDEEAIEVLGALDFGSLTMEGVLAVAATLVVAGDAHNAHWMIRKRAEQELVGRPDPADAALWLAGFPRGFAPSVERWSQHRNLDSNLVLGLIREESAFDAPVVSWAGAVGLMQLMPATAREEAGLEKIADFELGGLTEPDLNIRLGSAHIARRIRTFRGNHALAVAAYNAGPGKVKKWLKKAPAEELDVYLEAIPIEQTRHYTKRVLRSWAVYRFLYAPDTPFVELRATTK